MKPIKWLNLFAMVMVMVLSVAAVGCKRKGPGVTPLGGPGSVGTSGQRNPLDDGFVLPPETPIGFGGGDLATFNPDDFHQDRAALATYTVYFDYDSATIRSGDQSKVQSVAAALRSDPSARLLVEGHCDERGTEEYNRSLGERRALAIREALAVAGVEPARVATRSYGEDRPADPSSNENAWRLNRRGEFVLLHPR